MNSHPWPENRELTVSISINPKKPTKGLYYMALTFGTLLSSQGTDAHRPHPHRLHRWRLCPLHTGRPHGLARRLGERYTTFAGPCRGVPRPGPRTRSGDADRPELHTDPRPH